MHFGTLETILTQCPKNTALLGLDVGKKTIGLALSTPDQTLATPLHTIKRTKFTADMVALAAVVKEFEVGGLIVGLPVQMDGEEGKRAQSVRDFAREMLNHPDVVGPCPWVALYDERLSTRTVEDFVDNTVGKRKTRINAKESGLIDKLAAQIILQSALEHMRRC